MEKIVVDITLHLSNERKHIRFQGNHRLALVGPSGCGKSTLVKSLVGVSPLGQGQFLFNQQDLMTLKPWEREIGYLPQDYILMPHLNVKENLLLPKNARFDSEITDHLGITSLLGRMPRHLSGGEKQRVALARALSSSSKLLILDEPFSALDIKTKERVIRFLDEFLMKNALPLILISHEKNDISDLECECFSLIENKNF